MSESPLKDYLIQMAVKHENLAHSLHWHLELERFNETNEPRTTNFYNEMWNELMEELEDKNNVVYEAINGGRVLRERMHSISVWLKEDLRGLKTNPKKLRFRDELRNAQKGFYLFKNGEEGLSSPLDPKIKCYAVEAEDCTIFRSAI